MSSSLGFDPLDALLLNPSAFGNETGSIPLGTFYPGTETKQFINEVSKILVIGAGA